MKGETSTMSTTKTVKKTSTKVPTKNETSRINVKKVKEVPVLALDELSGEQLVVENLSTLSSLVGTLSETLDVLVQKVENMAYHLIATEEVLAEVVTSSGVDLVRVNARIRAKIANGTDKQGDPTRSIDIAAGIASPNPRCK
jgi:IMP dehydrogenase/GMP reductase